MHRQRTRQLERALPLQLVGEGATKPKSLQYWLARKAEWGEGKGEGKPELGNPELADLIDISHWDGISLEVQKNLLQMAYTKEKTLYKYLDDVAESLDDPERVRMAIHSLTGIAKTAGARRLAAEVLIFKEAPTAEGVTKLRRTLSLTHRHLQAAGLLPT